MKGLLTICVIIIIICLFLPQVGLAQSFESEEMISSLEMVGTTSGLSSLSNSDFTLIIARVIRTVLNYVGILLLAMILYGGFLYMISGGAEEKTKRARAAIFNGIIGLFIVLSSYSIVKFVFGAVM